MFYNPVAEVHANNDLTARRLDQQRCDPWAVSGVAQGVQSLFGQPATVNDRIPASLHPNVLMSRERHIRLS